MRGKLLAFAVFSVASASALAEGYSYQGAGGPQTRVPDNATILTAPATVVTPAAPATIVTPAAPATVVTPAPSASTGSSTYIAPNSTYVAPASPAVVATAPATMVSPQWYTQQ